MRIHFIGIKGSGMSSLAIILKNLGNDISGSDIDDFVFTETKLNENDIEIFSFSENNLQNKDVYVVTRAYSELNNIEVKYLKENNIKFYFYEEYLGLLAKNYYSIAVSGTHGKTTTTGLLATVLPNIIDTGYLIGDGSGMILKSSTHLVFEACEYRRHFLNYFPNIGLINNFEMDHPDYFKSEEDVIDAFESFLNQSKDVVFINGDNLKTLKLNEKCQTFGFSKNNKFIIFDVLKNSDHTSFKLKSENEILYFEIPFFGNHMILNSVATFLITKYLKQDLSVKDFETYLKQFKGQKRRFNIYDLKHQIVIDDYAHHPTEIIATFDSVKQKYGSKKNIVIFEPHTFTRTKALKKEFIDALNNFDEVYVMDIFGSPREMKNDFKIEELLVGKIKYYDDYVFNYLKKEDAVICFLGAGSISNEVIRYLK